MTNGSLVILLSDPLAHGIGIIDHFTASGLAHVRFEDDHEQDLDPMAIDTIDRWWGCLIEALNEHDLAALRAEPKRHA
jgi:hypothetical protein